MAQSQQILGVGPPIGEDEGQQEVERARTAEARARRDADHGVANQIEAAKPVSLRMLNQNLEDIFLAAVGDDSSSAMAALNREN